MTFRNRILEYGVKPADQFLAHPKNARIHPVYQREVMKSALETVGFVAPVIEAKSGYLLDGHERIYQALAQNNAPVPFVVVDVDEDEESYVLATFDPITSLAHYDAELLDSLLRDVQSDNEHIQKMLAELAESAGLYLDDTPQVDPEPQIDRAAELQQTWQTEVGQLWTIGKHRLLVGDCTIAANVERLMAGEKADMMFTDPPYGVNYEGGHFHSGDVNIKRERPKLEGDSSTALYSQFLPVVLPHVDGPCYMWFADREGYEPYRVLRDNRCEIHALIIWNKINATYAAMNAQYKQRHEPCIYFKPKNSTLRWVGASDEATIWEIKRDSVNEWHPTQKPVELATKAINNHDVATVLDPFLGSGTTLVACEQLGRQGRGMELEPKYAAVILQRLTDMGLTPRLEGD